MKCIQRLVLIPITDPGENIFLLSKIKTLYFEKYHKGVVGDKQKYGMIVLIIKES